MRIRALRYLSKHVLELNDLGPEFLLCEELLRLHLFYLAHVRVLAVLQHGAILLQLRLQLYNKKTLQFTAVSQDL